MAGRFRPKTRSFWTTSGGDCSKQEAVQLAYVSVIFPADCREYVVKLLRFHGHSDTTAQWIKNEQVVTQFTVIISLKNSVIFTGSIVDLGYSPTVQQRRRWRVRTALRGLQDTAGANELHSTAHPILPPEDVHGTESVWEGEWKVQCWRLHLCLTSLAHANCDSFNKVKLTRRFCR